MKQGDLLTFEQLQRTAKVGTVFFSCYDAKGNRQFSNWRLITRDAVQIADNIASGSFGRTYACAEMFNALDVVQVVSVPADPHDVFGVAE